MSWTKVGRISLVGYNKGFRLRLVDISNSSLRQQVNQLSAEQWSPVIRKGIVL